MAGDTGVGINFKIFNDDGNSSYEDDGRMYIVHLNERDATVHGADEILRDIFDKHANGSATSSFVFIHVSFLFKPSVNTPRYMEMAHAIAHAVDQIRGDATFNHITILFEDVGIETILAWLPTLPASIENIETGMCKPGKWAVPSGFWESLPLLKKIDVLTSRTDEGYLGPNVGITRPLNL